MAKLILLFALINQTVQIHGKVSDASTGNPLPFAAMGVKGTPYGTYADSLGQFILNLPPGEYTLEFRVLGYRSKTIEMTIRRDTFLHVRLYPEPIKLKGIIVTPGAVTVESGATPGSATLTTMDIVKLPGGAADLMWALQSLPGVASRGDFAAISVQGGNPDELAVYVNGLRMPHPYHYEGAGGGLFSFIKPSLIQSATFLMGGFPVVYGDALSGILDIKLKSQENSSGGSFDMNMAGIELYLHTKNFMVSLNRSYTDLLGKLFFSSTEFTLFPRAWDIQSVFAYSLGKNLNLSHFVLLGGDATGIDLSKDYDFQGSMLNHDTKGLIGTRILKKIGKTTLSFSTGVNFYSSSTDLGGVWQFDLKERNFENRFNLESRISERFYLLTGVELSRLNYIADLIVPKDSLLWRDPDAPADTLNFDVLGYRAGGYLSLRYALTSKIFLESGVRYDYLDITRKSSLSPRLGIAWEYNNTTLRIASGVYHQLPSGRLLTGGEVSSVDLIPFPGAKHITGSVSHKFESGINFDFQVFYKDYDRLAVPITDGWSFDGTGYAYGAHLLFKVPPTKRFQGWLAYTYLRSYRSMDSTLTEKSSNYDTPHILTVVGNYYIGKGWSVGLKLRAMTGRPYTPVIGTFTPDSIHILPVLGEVNSRRFPYYFRMDMRFLRMSKVFGLPIVSYFEFLNLTNRKNIAAYVYNKDYTQKKPVFNFGFMVVGGFAINF